MRREHSTHLCLSLTSAHFDRFLLIRSFSSKLCLSPPNPFFLPDPRLFSLLCHCYSPKASMSQPAFFPAFHPQGHLHLHFSLEAFSTPFPTIPDGSQGSTGVFLCSVDILAPVMALSVWVQQFQGNSS